MAATSGPHLEVVDDLCVSRVLDGRLKQLDEELLRPEAVGRSTETLQGLVRFPAGRGESNRHRGIRKGKDDILRIQRESRAIKVPVIRRWLWPFTVDVTPPTHS